MIFIQKQILLLLALLSGSGEPILANAKTSSLFWARGFHPLDPQQGTTPAPRWRPRRLTDSTAGRGPLAPSAGYFFLFSCNLQCRRFLLTRNLLAKAQCRNFPRRGGDGASQRERGGGGEREESIFFSPSPPPFPSFALEPTVTVTISTLPNLPLS